MSTPLENIPQNCSEYSNSNFLDMPIDYQCPFLHSEIANTLKHMVTQSKTQLTQVNMAEPTSVEDGRRKAKMTTNTTVGEVSISFQLPTDCIINKIDMDKFYCHSKSRTMFRFITEVVNFLQYAIYCETENPNKVTLEENSVKGMSKASAMKRKRKSTCSKSAKRQRFFSNEDSYNFDGLQNVTSENMLKAPHTNITNTTNREMEEDKQENYLEKYLGKMIASKGQKFLTVEKELSGTKMGTAQIVDATLLESNVELKGNGSLDVMLGIYKIANIDQNEVNYKFQDLRDEISMDWTENDALIDTYFEECDLIYHIPICKSIDELIEFLITERNKRQG
ncbi:hypothetical protein D0Y65_006511 [Glycine soja]|uniref:Uncharacterized protein n=1 Tax=Glycine soja TaxID=3848 RepID=A0A445L8V7_GLYSO|nr:hypothetical protein D0Y65_006511 [Glycine soja]